MKTIAVFVHQPYCSVQSDNGIIEALTPHYRFKIFTKHPLETNFFDDVDCVCIPGGLGDAEKFDMCFEHNGKKIKQFVKQGGKYLGICMGGYWAGSLYLDILKDCNTVQYIKRPGTDTRRPHAKNISVVWNNTPLKMFFYDGFAVVGNRSKFETIATYANNDPMAIIQKNIGIIGCHPEATANWYDDYSWMKNKYTNHHSLLLAFVKKLMGD